MSNKIDPFPRPDASTLEEERAYLLKRAGQHGRLAETAADQGSQMIHLRLQQLYAMRASMTGIVVPD